MESHISSSASMLSDDQITSMLVNESGVQLTSDLIRQFNVTPNLCATLLFAICDNSRQEPSHLHRGSEDIDNLANICREFLPSASPLADIIKAIDAESFVQLNGKIMAFNNDSKFVKFWQFCLNLCNTDKQGKPTLVHSLSITSINHIFHRRLHLSCFVLWKTLEPQCRISNRLHMVLCYASTSLKAVICRTWWSKSSRL